MKIVAQGKLKEIFNDTRDYSDVNCIKPEIYISKCGKEWNDNMNEEKQFSVFFGKQITHKQYLTEFFELNMQEHEPNMIENTYVFKFKGEFRV